jgi:tubulin-specific chaperone D
MIYGILTSHVHRLWRRLLSAVIKSHYRSHNISKLLGALDVYRGLADVKAIRGEVCVKVKNMLLHPFPKVALVFDEYHMLIWFRMLTE